MWDAKQKYFLDLVYWIRVSEITFCLFNSFSTTLRLFQKVYLLNLRTYAPTYKNEENSFIPIALLRQYYVL